VLARPCAVNRRRFDEGRRPFCKLRWQVAHSKLSTSLFWFCLLTPRTLRRLRERLAAFGSNTAFRCANNQEAQACCQLCALTKHCPRFTDDAKRYRSPKAAISGAKAQAWPVCGLHKQFRLCKPALAMHAGGDSETSPNKLSQRCRSCLEKLEQRHSRKHKTSKRPEIKGLLRALCSLQLISSAYLEGNMHQSVKLRPAGFGGG